MIASCRAARLPALSGDSDVFSISQNDITKRWRLSNTLFVPPHTKSTDNKAMDIVEKINKRLGQMGESGWTWSDLAREMEITPERINNWKKRGVPAGQIKHIAAALGMQRLELEGDGSTQLRELTEEQVEVLDMWDLLLSSQREQVKQWAAYTLDVLSEKGGGAHH